MPIFKKNKKFAVNNISPDEIFLDSKNISNFDFCQFEGRIEKPIGGRSLVLCGLFMLLLLFVLFSRTGYLQLVDGERLAVYAQNNHLRSVKLPAERGLIYDRNGELLVWNEAGFRDYKRIDGVGHVLGYTGISYEELVGKDGVEKNYDEILRGQNGIKLSEINSKGEVGSENVQQKPRAGSSLHLTIDSGLQQELYEILKTMSLERGFEGGASVIIDVLSGEVLAMASYPEYRSHVLAGGGPEDIIENYFSDPQKPFVNRAVSGLYAPGSVIKPFVALAALNENIIEPEKEILSTGSISIPNPYLPDKKSFFYDWKAHGWVDMRTALAVSSNVYFYTIGGGYENMNGLGIKKIEEYMHLFGLGEKTGIFLPGEAEGLVPDPSIKKDDPTDSLWRIGDTYNVSIGQGDFQVTPLQMAVATAMIANNGFKIHPVIADEGRQTVGQERLPILAEYFNVVKEGMRGAVEFGTALGLSGLPVKIAAKTGTAELGSGKFVNSWLIAFWPYENPRFAMSIVLEKGRASNLIGGVFATNRLFEWMAIHRGEYLTH